MSGDSFFSTVSVDELIDVQVNADNTQVVVTVDQPDVLVTLDDAPSLTTEISTVSEIVIDVETIEMAVNIGTASTPAFPLDDDVTYGYDANDRLTTLTYDYGEILTYTYNPDDTLAQVTSNLEIHPLETHTYDGNGLLIRTVFGLD